CRPNRLERRLRLQYELGPGGDPTVTESGYGRDRAPGHQPRRSRSANTRESTPAKGARAQSPTTMTSMMIKASMAGAWPRQAGRRGRATAGLLSGFRPPSSPGGRSADAGHAPPAAPAAARPATRVRG